MIEILKALSDETRLTLIHLLIKHDYCVGALASRLKLSESAVSQHLKILRNAELVRGDKRGYYTHYGVNREVLREAADQLVKLSMIQPEKQGCQNPEAEKNCSCCKMEKSK